MLANTPQLLATFFADDIDFPWIHTWAYLGTKGCKNGFCVGILFIGPLLCLQEQCIYRDEILLADGNLDLACAGGPQPPALSKRYENPA